MNYIVQIKKFRDALIASDIGHLIAKMVWVREYLAGDLIALAEKRVAK